MSLALLTQKSAVYRIVLALLIIGAIIARISPHVPNVAPITAIALLAGATLTAPWSVIVPLTAMVISDSIIGFDQLEITAAVYGSFVLAVLLGRWLRGGFKPWRVIGASLASSVLFYLVTNGAVWWWSGMYAHSFDGLTLSYFYAIPFFRHTLLGDLMYSVSLFLAVQYVPVLMARLQLAIKQSSARKAASLS